MSSRQEPIAQMIVAANQKVCNAVLERIKTMYNNLIDYDYLIVTGGTAPHGSTLSATISREWKR